MVVSLTCEAIVSEVGEKNMFLEGPGLEWLAAQDAMEMNRADDGCRGGVRKRTCSAQDAEQNKRISSQLVLPLPSISPPWAVARLKSSQLLSVAVVAPRLSPAHSAHSMSVTAQSPF